MGINDSTTRYVYENGQLVALIYMGMIDGELEPPHREVVMEIPLFSPNDDAAEKIEEFYNSQGEFIAKACNYYQQRAGLGMNWRWAKDELNDGDNQQSQRIPLPSAL